MTKIAVLAGGTSDEREVSLRSGAAVSEALLSKGYDVVTLDPTTDFNELLPALKSVDVVFPALHGKSGEDGTLQAFLEAHGIDFVGSDSAASTLCFDKVRFGTLLESKRITVPKTALVDQAAFEASPLGRAPYVLKPNDGGSSIDTLIVRDVSQVDEAVITDIFNRRQQMVLQELVLGIEITVALLFDKPLPVIEIIPPADQEFDYENKYNGATQEICPAQQLSIDIQEKAQLLAKQIHELTGCRDMSRTDMIITEKQELYVLETNTIPGLTSQSLLPKAAQVGGYDMPRLADELVKAALTRRGTH